MSIVRSTTSSLYLYLYLHLSTSLYLSLYLLLFFCRTLHSDYSHDRQTDPRRRDTRVLANCRMIPTIAYELDYLLAVGNNVDLNPSLASAVPLLRSSLCWSTLSTSLKNIVGRLQDIQLERQLEEKQLNDSTRKDKFLGVVRSHHLDDRLWTTATS